MSDGGTKVWRRVIPVVPGPVRLLLWAVFVGVVSARWPTWRRQISLAPPVTVINVGISANRPAYTFIASRGVQKTRGDFQFEPTSVEDGDDPEQKLKAGSKGGGVDLLWTTVDYLPFLLKKSKNARVIMKVASSHNLDAIVLRKKQIGSRDLISVPSYGPGHWVLDKQLPGECKLHRWPSPDPYRDLTDGNVTNGKTPAVQGAYLSGMELQAWRASHEDVEQQDIEIEDLLVANEDFVTEHEVDLAKVVDKWLSPATALEVVKVFPVLPFFQSAQPKIDQLDLIEMLQNVKWSTLEDNHNYFCSGPDSKDSVFTSHLTDARNFWTDHSSDLNEQVAHNTTSAVLDQDVLNRVFRNRQTASEDSQRQSGKHKSKTLCDPVWSGEFLFDKDDLDPEDMEKLAETLNELAGLEKATFVIRGFTDSKGEASINIDLSQRRADAVKKILLEQPKLRKAQIDAKGEGAKGSKNDSETVMAGYRRADLFIFF